MPSLANGLARQSLAAVLAMLLAAMAAMVRARAEDAPTGDAGNGKRLYLATGCFECHGRVGEGGAFNGPAPVLARTVLPFESFKYQLREPLNDMPAYSAAVLPDSAAADIYAYVRSLPGPTSPDANPLLKQ